MSEFAVGRRADVGIQNLCWVMLNNLASYYSDIAGPKTFEDFLTEVYGTVSQRDDPKIEGPYEIVRTILPPPPGLSVESLPAKYSTMIVACAYIKRTLAAEASAGEGRVAWNYMADATYWCGVTMAEKGIDSAYNNTIQETKSKQGASGGSGRAKKYRPVAEFAQDLARKEKPVQGWRSRSHAVRVIKQKVLDFARNQGIGMSDEQADTTIDGWLAKVDGAAQLFKRAVDESATSKDS